MLPQVALPPPRYQAHHSASQLLSPMPLHHNLNLNRTKGRKKTDSNSRDQATTMIGCLSIVTVDTAYHYLGAFHRLLLLS